MKIFVCIMAIRPRKSMLVICGAGPILSQPCVASPSRGCLHAKANRARHGRYGTYRVIEMVLYL